ncbi:phosphate regulon sensor histidine kinase PhoR [Marinobacterium arenosum]|uniref:phosphate regulon sensor histidine kinase PhoR n=1 Tax=Marinobacterium arenosum TaxID=2862496 RepID=UPI001C972138|nr:phosphate regulon sensor histidine kinase PhoR [Marinobacterium arenosum]MBY4676538.1 phosphate regulon sensor histidine kinase PhoR [Marinobacterium arenosum]
MTKPRHSILGSLLIVMSAAVAIGFITGQVAWCLAIAAIAWSLYQIRQFDRLIQWLQGENDSEPPESFGHWGDLFDELSRQQKRQRSREDYLRNIISRFQQSSAALHDAVVIIDRDNNLEWWNRAADRLIGLRAASDRGKPVMNLLRDPRFIRYFKKGSYAEPLQLPSPVNSDIQLQYLITEFGEGDRLLVARDITRLTKLEQTRQDFVANASHELRTPLTVIRGYLETYLEQDLPSPLTRGLQQMQQQSRRMENLVSDLLLLSRLEASQQISDEHPIQIHSMLQHIYEDAVELGREKGHQFQLEMDDGYDLLGQEIELHSAFSNLVFNAVRYTPADGEIRIRWWVDKEGGHFSVQDNGIGIDSIHIPRLTERFYRVDESRSSSSGGTGLGLAIVKHVLARHGAHLTIKSKSGQGSTFACHFPHEMVTAARLARLEDDDDDFDDDFSDDQQDSVA